MILVTGASGQLGRLVIAELLKTVPAEQIIAAVRSPEKVADLAEQGVQVRAADYTQPETLSAAFTGVEKVLLVASVLLLMIVELLNSAIESVVDRFVPEWNEFAGPAKDMGYAAVFLAIGTLWLTWALVLLM